MSTILRAVHNFTSENEDEITFNVNDLIEVVERDDLYSDGWWQGKVLPDGPVGLFPSAFTAPCDAVQALYDFHAEHKDELTFYAGDVIYVLEEDGPFGDDWWKGRSTNGLRGLFPRAYTVKFGDHVSPEVLPTKGPDVDRDRKHTKHSSLEHCFVDELPAAYSETATMSGQVTTGAEGARPSAHSTTWKWRWW